MIIDGTTIPIAVVSLMRRRRLQVLVHSCIYYRFNTNLIDDHQYDAWGKELVELQRKYGVLKIDCYDKDFEEWQPKEGNSFSGFKLPIWDEKIISLATRLIDYTNEINKKKKYIAAKKKTSRK